MISIGDEAKDFITGFAGMVMAKTEYMTSEPRYCIQPMCLSSNGTPAESEWFDQGRLVPVVKNNFTGFRKGQ